ncbi:MAG: peptidoglycan-binding protein [Pyrinomonadaceae bacterium]
MLKKILLVICVSVLFALGSYAQEGSASTKTEKSASTSDASAKPAAFRPSKEQIRKGQEILIAQKLWDGEATGVYGESRPAIKAYQKANGLEQTGKFDRPTLAKMNIPLTDKQKGIESTSESSSSSKTKSSNSSEGTKRIFQATKDQIKALQTKLKEAKLFSGEANGERSDELKAAVKKYQDANGLNATGGINAATLEKMGIALTDKQKGNVAVQKSSDTGSKDKKDTKDSSDED